MLQRFEAKTDIETCRVSTQENLACNGMTWVG